jgi:TetR/AcrR family transcriptional regulator
LTRKDYDDGEDTIMRMVMAAISLPAGPHGHAQME